MVMRKRGKPLPGPVDEEESNERQQLAASPKTPAEATVDAEADAINAARPAPLPRRGRPGMQELPRPDHAPAFGRIVSTMVDRARALLEEPDLYGRLEAALQVQGAGTPEQVKASLNVVDRAAADAHLAYLACKEEFARFERDMEVFTSGWRKEAMAKLEALKADKKFSKQIAEADVQHQMASLYPDQWREAEERRAQAELTVKQFQRVADLLQKRAYSLGGMLPH